MQILTGSIREQYLNQYHIQNFFSFDIMPFVQVFEFEKGEFIFQEGSNPVYLYYLLEGKAKLYVTHKNGKVSLIDFLSEPCFIGELELVNEGKHTRGIQTVTKTVCIAIAIHECKKQLLSDAVFLRHICIFLGEKASNMTTKYTQNQAYPLENRLAAFMQLSSDQGIYKEKHTEVCDYLGVSYRHLLYVLAQFCENNIIVKNGRGYQIIDEEKIALLANEIL